MKVTLKYFLLVSEPNGQQHSLLEENYASVRRLHGSARARCANEHGNPGTLLITSIHMNLTSWRKKKKGRKKKSAKGKL